MKILFDTNVILDVLLKRSPYDQIAVRLLSGVEQGLISGLISATTVTTIFYLARKSVGRDKALKDIRNLLKLFTVAPVNRPVIEEAIDLRFTDFEDAILHEAARHAGAEGIVTRNITDFKHGTLYIYTPNDLLQMLLAMADESDHNSL